MTQSLINLRAEILVAIEVNAGYITSIGPSQERFSMEEYIDAIGEMERLSGILDNVNETLTEYFESLEVAKEEAAFQERALRKRFNSNDD